MTSASMAEAATAVVGGTVVGEAGLFPASILIDPGGTIAGVLSPGVKVHADTTLDASGYLIFPGGVDTHSHFNDPGLTESEDFLTGTSGAAAGGYTTVLEMPQTLPLVDSVATFRHKRDTVAPKAIVDFGLYCALVPANSKARRELAMIAGAGAIALKGFVCDTPEMPTLSEPDLSMGFRNAGEVGLRVAIHAESQADIDAHTVRVKLRGARTAAGVADSHPLSAERSAVRTVLAAARAAAGRLHLVHLSDPSTVALATRAKASGIDVSAETCPHYLSLTRQDVVRTGGWGLCFPPLRTRASVDGLWTAVANGHIDAIGSDHCAYTLGQKVTDDPWAVLPGITGVQMALPVLVHEAHSRGIELQAVARAFSSRPARAFSLHPKKGTIQRGADADLVFVDTNSTTTGRIIDMYTRCPGTVYEGLTYHARVRRTMVRGTTVYLDDDRPEIKVQPGFGAFLDGAQLRAEAQGRPDLR
jgi:allantoinase